MRSAGARKFFLLAVLLLAFAAFAHQRSSGLHAEGGRKLAAAQQEAATFASTFDGAAQDRELALLDARRAVLKSASLWNRTGRLAFGASMLCLFAAWVSYELAKLRGSAPARAPVNATVRPRHA